MTLDDILRMAREAGLQPAYDAQGPAIERFAALVAAAEREQCAILLETYGLDLCPGDNDMQRYFERTKSTREYYAAAIRARSNQ